MKAPLIFASACALMLSSAYGQVYLLQGSPTSKYSGGYSTSLLRAGADGSVQKIADILPGGSDGGAAWIGTSSDARKAVILSKLPSHRIVVVDFDSASVAKSCVSPPPPAGMSEFPFQEWLADIPGTGLVFAERYGTADTAKLSSGRSSVGDDTVRVMLVDGSVSCGQSFMAGAPGDIKFLTTDGQSGVADLGSWETQNVGVAADGVPAAGWFGG